MLSDLGLAELRQYRPDVAEPADFDEFWASELTAARGLADPRGYSYPRLSIDAARAPDAARQHPAAAGLPLVTTGKSQGGGLSIAAAHLGDDVAAALPDVPFLAHFRRAVDVTDERPY